jgi:hypothetical protein
MRRSRWREFIEARDAVLGILGRPLLPSEFIRSGRIIGSMLANNERARESWDELSESLLESLG